MPSQHWRLNRRRFLQIGAGALIVGGAVGGGIIAWDKTHEYHALPQPIEAYCHDGCHWSVPQITAGTLEQLRVPNARGGKLLTIPHFDLSRPGAQWNSTDMEMDYVAQSQGSGYYRLQLASSAFQNAELTQAASAHTIPILPNRQYVVSLLLATSFDRVVAIKNRHVGIECNVGMLMGSSQSTNAAYQTQIVNGLPARTEGWIRWEWEFTSSERGDVGVFYLANYGFGLFPGELRLADVTFIELPPRPVVPFAKGTGVTFRGGPGSLPLAVAPPQTSNDVLIVTTRGTQYAFDRAQQRIIGKQVGEDTRVVANWHVSLPLSDLQVLATSATVCVLGNDALTIGVQCDGMVMIAPHADLTLTLTSQIGGTWNRFISGHLLVVDDRGGFTVNPALPVGSGRQARADLITPDLDFAGKLNDTTSLSAAMPGWQATWQISPGERIALSIFPPRPYDWRASFEQTSMLAYTGTPTTDYAQLWSTMFQIAILFDFDLRTYGMSYSAKWAPNDEEQLVAHIAAIKAAGMHNAAYMSPYFFYSLDADEYLVGVKDWKDRYGIEGLYIDGLPDSDWLLGYEIMRLLRELFPDGFLYLHSTGEPADGGPPLHLPDIFIPAIDTYATVTNRGENIPIAGEDWPYPNYVAAGYHKSSVPGTLNHRYWAKAVPSWLKQYAIMLQYNGRAAAWGDYKLEPGLSELRAHYIPWLRQLQSLWEQHGHEPDFFARYYLPTVQGFLSSLK